jgi:regulator of protease activity HflC (stomatin/prohibitin superfamily)
VRTAGFHWVNPLTIRRHVSLRIRNLDTDVLKVNDANGNPIEISAVITWQVRDAAQAVFDVERYEDFVDIQAETAVRHVASVFPYDAYEERQPSLSGAADRVIATLHDDLQERLDVAGVAVFDTRLRRLAFAPEIAADMLRRQQANAVVAARQRIVEGAVGMVDHALSSLSERDIVELDEERKAAMVSNLMVVLVSDRGAQPVVNSGSLYT